MLGGSAPETTLCWQSQREASSSSASMVSFALRGERKYRSTHQSTQSSTSLKVLRDCAWCPTPYRESHFLYMEIWSLFV